MSPTNVPTMYYLHTFGVGTWSLQIIVVGTHVPTTYYLQAFRVGTSCDDGFGMVSDFRRGSQKSATVPFHQYSAVRPAEYCWFPVVLVFRHGSEKFASTPKPWRRPSEQSPRGRVRCDFFSQYVFAIVKHACWHTPDNRFCALTQV